MNLCGFSTLLVSYGLNFLRTHTNFFEPSKRTSWEELSEEEQELANRKSLKSVVQSSSDDDEANEDLSLKIVEKALLMSAAKLISENDAVAVDRSGSIGHPSSSSWVAEVEAADLETTK
ncbi:hypothetical protein M0R45_029594 [Rubus argutus]|uniref:Uncharacterized protein n=1 Tax=Rubus argutus TaxID=59490 RepID=A0AAW1WAQ6_RUBAR